MTQQLDAASLVPVHRWRLSPRRVAPYLFLAPFALMFATFIIAPLAYAFWMSVFRDSLVGGQRFVGAANYIRVLGDRKFWEGLGNLAVFGAVQIPIMLCLALFLAVVLDRGRAYGGGLLRLGLFLPYAVPGVIAALIWGYIYGPVFGPLTQIAVALDLPTTNFLSREAMLFSLANIATWEFLGYYTMIFTVALRAIPRDIGEAAMMDGASQGQFARFVQLPLLWPAILLAIIFSINGTLQLFNEPYVMRAYAPAVINSSYTPNLYAYSLATANQQNNYAAAVSFVLGATIAGASLLFVLVSSRWRRR